MENNTRKHTYGCLITLFIAAILLIILGLLLDYRRALGRYIYISNSAITMSIYLAPDDDGLLTMSIFDQAISPLEVEKHRPIARYRNFTQDGNFYCGIRDSIGYDCMYIWVRPYAETVYEDNTENIHFSTYILPPDTVRTNVFDIDMGLGMTPVKICPNNAKKLVVLELPWHKILLYHMFNSVRDIYHEN